MMVHGRNMCSAFVIAVTYFDKKDTLCNTSCLLKDVHFVIRAAVVSYRHIIMYTIFKELSY